MRAELVTADRVKNYIDVTRQDMTHIVVDEIHERDRFADFLLILLRDALPANPHLRLVRHLAAVASACLVICCLSSESNLCH